MRLSGRQPGGLSKLVTGMLEQRARLAAREMSWAVWSVVPTLLGLLWLAGCPARAAPAGAQTWPALLTCEWGVFQLQCRFRPLVPVSIQGVEVVVDGGPPQPVSDWQPFAKSGAASAVLWLIDVSNPARSDTVVRQIALLRNWLEGMGAQHRTGLATFADGALSLAPIGSDAAVLAKALENLAARGHSTAFYHSLLDGVGLLKDVQAERKSLWVLSDGLAEDKAYGHADVIAAARASGIIIVGLGYPERESQQTDLQRLQRLAEDTGGYFAAAPVRGALPAATLTDILAVVDGGGSFRVDLPGLYGPHRLGVRLRAASGGVFEKILDIQGPPPPPPQPAAQIQAVGFGARHTVGWLAAGMVMLALLAWLLGRRRRPLPEPPILARLELLNSVAAGKLAVRAPVFRIGRARSNDLRLTNDSVSAYHAELHRHRDGTFAVIDLGSTNGVWVNGEQVRNHSLRDGDVLELGEVRLRFWQVP